MACSCKGNAGGAAKEPSSYQIKRPDGTIVSYRSKVEAQAAAKRTGGVCQNC